MEGECCTDLILSICCVSVGFAEAQTRVCARHCCCGAYLFRVWCTATSVLLYFILSVNQTGPSINHTSKALHQKDKEEMNDRLSELTRGKSLGEPVPFEIAIDINDSGDGGLALPHQQQQGRFMEGFFDKVNLVKKDIDAVKKVCAC